MLSGTPDKMVATESGARGSGSTATRPPQRHPTFKNAGAGPDRRLNAGTPRWVKVFGIVALALFVLFLILHLAGLSPMSHMHGS